jgi:hypothetical protein
MNESVVQVVDVKFLARGSYITIIKKETFLASINGRDHPIASDVKLTLLDEQWSFYVLLKNEC